MSASNPEFFHSSNRPIVDSTEADLVLAQFAGQILSAYEAAMDFRPLVNKQTVQGTDRLQLIALGKLNADWHEPGTEVAAQDGRSDDRYIRLDRRALVSSFEMYNWHEFITQFSVRSQRAMQIVDAIARIHDEHIVKRIARGSLINASNTGGAVVAGYDADAVDAKLGTPGGTVLTADLDDAGVASTSDGTRLYDTIAHAAEIMDRKDVPQEGRYCAITPEWWRYLRYQRNSVSEFIHLNSDFMQVEIANSPDRNLEFFNINGIKVFKSVRLGKVVDGGGETSLTGVSTLNERYALPTTNLRAVCWQQDAVLDVMAGGGMIVNREERPGYLSDRIIASALKGTDIARPESCITVWDDAQNLTTLDTFRQNEMTWYNNELGGYAS